MEQSNTFIYNNKAYSDRWLNTFSNAILINADEVKSHVPAQGIIWISTTIDDWSKLVQRYSSSGHVVVLTPYRNLEELKIALSAGARGYDNITCNKDRLNAIHHSISNGASWVPSNLLSNILSLLNSKSRSDDLKNTLIGLTSREQQVVEFVLQGFSNKQIAKNMDITERTIKAHMSSVFRKLDVNDRFQLLIKIKG